MSLSVIVVGTIAWFVAVALVMGDSRGRRIAGLALASVGLVAPWCVANPLPLARAFAALGAMLFFMRCVDLATMRPRGWGPMRRLAHATSLVDSRLLSPAPSRFALDRIAAALAYGVLASAAVGVILASSSIGNVACRWVVRWAAGATFVYAGADSSQSVARAIYAAAGFRTPEMHRVPIASRTLTDFWGERWNRTVSIWLREHAFRPFARARHAALGVAAAFVVSGVIHWYLAEPAVGERGAITSAVFFLVQAVLVGIELRLGVRRWPTVAARAWTLAGVLLPAPLLVEPIVRIAFPMALAPG